MANLKDIRARITSVGSTMQITSAMKQKDKLFQTERTQLAHLPSFCELVVIQVIKRYFDLIGVEYLGWREI